MATVQEIIAEEWRGRASELADWAMQRLVNRRDVWGQYAVLTPSEQRNSDRSYKAMTLPAVNQRDENENRVTLDKLTRHFASRRLRKPQLIGLHAKSKSATSLWFGIDIDNHGDDASSMDDIARRNLNAAVTWHRKLQRLGYDPFLIDSNGAGGYHLWVLLEQPAPTEDVFAFAMSITADWEERQLEKQPETFPKRVKKDSLGSWFRLPGLHHTKDHHARVWNGDDGLDDSWLTGHSAIDALLSCVPGPPPATVSGDPVLSTNQTSSKQGKMSAYTNQQTDAQPGDRVPAVARRTHSRTRKARVCVDLDGVLAQHSGNSSIGPPMDGAVEFTRELQESAHIIIYTARFSTTRGKARSASATAALEKRLTRWLERHGFAWDSISTGVSKPIASAYVDDRAVPCRPLEHGLAAFDQALSVVRDLTDS
ncbi:MAG: hypothetical protein AB8B79_06140 [Granulosicoccus sp.]